MTTKRIFICFFLICIGVVLSGCVLQDILASIPALSDIPAILTTKTQTPSPTFQPTDIPAILNLENGHQYFVFKVRLFWNDARNSCAKMGAHLLTIESEAENSFVQNLAYQESADMSELYWIGYTDEVEENDWVWVTGEPARFTDWGGEEPDNCQTGCINPTEYEEENFAFITYSDHWQDGGFAELFYICEWENAE